jgi:TolA-binding protein
MRQKLRGRRTRLFVALAAVAFALATGPASAQSFRRAGTEFNAVRQVNVPAGKPYTIIVCEFLDHGEIHADGGNVVVAARNGELAPLRILQVGPGDFCRLAFQTIKGPLEYEIFYGGDSPHEALPPWTCRDGLLLETRQFKPCDFWRLDSVRDAFNAATPIGADYVNGVFHDDDPLSLKREPFLSRYTGDLDIEKAGVYGFITSSQDCSFLLIDGKLVASAPGYHGPMRRARRGSRHDVTLSAGSHKFAYYHAAAGSSATMVAAWEIDPAGEKPRWPTIIPPEVFNAHCVERLFPDHVVLRTAKLAPDFTVKIIGDVPLPDDDVPLVGVLFHDASPKALQGAKLRWDFGDGQTSALPTAYHVYLRPGLYPVKLSIRRGGRTFEMTNRIGVDRPLLSYQDESNSLDEYLKVVESYDPATLDAASLRQMVLALEAKSLALARQSEEAADRAVADEEDPNLRRGATSHSALREEAAEERLSRESKRYLGKAVDAGKTAFVGRSAAVGDQDLLKLAQLVGPMCRARLGDSPSAFQIWQGAADRMAGARPKAECEIAAADVAVNDLLDAAAAKPLLEAATKHMGDGRSASASAMLHRVWGDYYAATGDGSAARREYLAAEAAGDSSRRFIENAAWLGAHARSTEEFIAAKQFDRAAEELEAWQRQFPAAKLDGYLTLLAARYWAGRGKYAQAIAQTEQLQAVSPDSPYVDQALLLAAECQMRLKRKDRALAALQSLVKDYPGSPLVPVAQKDIEKLERD